MNTMKEIADLMLSRFNAYQTLARFWIEEVDEAFWQGLKKTAFSSGHEASLLNSAYRKLEDYISSAPPDVLKELAADYALLCRSSNPKQGADPYESVHRNQYGLMMQDEWEEVLRFYHEAGLKRSPASVEPEDHLGLELECMAQLCQKFITAYEQKDEEACLNLIKMQLRLLEAHLLLWVPSFTEKVLKIAKTEFYKSVAAITNEYLIMDAEFMRSER